MQGSFLRDFNRSTCTSLLSISVFIFPKGMSSWESSPQPQCAAPEFSNGSSFTVHDYDDQWRSVKESLQLEYDDNEIPTGTDLDLPTVPSGRRRVLKKMNRPQEKPAKAKQQTLAERLSEGDIESLFSKYRGKEDEEEIAVDPRFLEDDSDKDEYDAAVNAESFLSQLTEGVQAPTLVPASAAVSVHSHNVSGPLIKLEDETLNFNLNGDSKPLKTKTSTSAGASYLDTNSLKEPIELASKLRSGVVTQPSVAVATTPTSEGLFYWLDAKEQPYTLSVDPGSLFLFGKALVEAEGKTPKYSSCCVRVQNVYRCLFLFPNPTSSQDEVVKEVNELCRSQGIEQRRIKFVHRYYAFEEPGLPREKSTWVKLRYPGKYPPLSPKRDTKHVLKILGAPSSLLELFLIKRKLRGPSFLRISNLVTAPNRISHCELEYVVDSPKNICVEEAQRPVPPFTLASVQLHAQLDEKGISNEIIAVSVAVYRDTNIESSIRPVPTEVFSGVRQLTVNDAFPMDLEGYCSAKGLPGVSRFLNETKLLTWLTQLLRSIDADIWIGHNFLGFTLDTLLRRFQELNVPGWSTIGRLDLKRLPRMQGTVQVNANQKKETCVGRLVADSYLLAREYYKSVNYKLQSLSSEMHLRGIAQGESAFDPGNSTLTASMMGSSSELFPILLQMCNCAVLSTAIINHLDAIRLTKRLTSIAGNLWSRTLFGARSERIEYLLLHAFHDLKFITPDKKTFGQKHDREEDGEEGRRKAKYQGGMVLDPKCGLYSDYILLLDFNSLYPSLIQEFNICFTTVDRTGEEATIPPPENLVCKACAAAGSHPPCLHKCILPKVIKGLVDSRRDVKRLMKSEKDESNLALLEIRQRALKLTANSMYGCLGFEHSRFHAQLLAELVTRQGRLALQNTVDLIPQINPTFRVIYGDTDSVMIQTGEKRDIAKIRDWGLEVKAKVNKQYRNLEIDIDGVFRAILLLKKKKYAALSVVDWQDSGTVYQREVKGLDMVRRDWCPLSKTVSDAVLNRVLHAEGSEDILDYIMRYVHDVAEGVRNGNRYTLADYVISKCLTKEPEAYRGMSFPHATVALRMKQRKELVRVGDLIPYVICEGDKLCDKAYHVEEVRLDKSLRIDTEWYLNAQIYPPVMRLCEHIQGFSHAQLSEAMGIVCRHGTRGEDEDNAQTLNDFSHSAMFKNLGLSECFPTAARLQVQCPHCLRKSPIDPHQRVMEMMTADPFGTDQFDLYVCTSCDRSLRVDFVANSFNQTCYRLLKEFYESGGSAAAVRAVRHQFTYFRALFDVPHAPGCPQDVKTCHRTRARRCLGIDGQLYTIEGAEVAERVEAEDPLHAAAETFYKRIDHLFVNLDALF